MRRSIVAKMVKLSGAVMLAGLLAGAVAARADDLSNQHQPDLALQQKLDLLDHEPDTPDAPLPRPDVTQGSFPRSMLIPGTNTSIRVYGSGTETMQYSR
jgi:hypothetical protein